MPAAINAWGGKKPLFGTNPIAEVFPRRNKRADSLPAEPAVCGQRAQAFAAASDSSASTVLRRPPLIVDLSLTEVARGKIMLAAKEGKLL